MKKALSDRFWGMVDKKSPNECWEWKASRMPFGHGCIFGNSFGEKLYAHRVSWVLHNGKIPKGLHVLHKCDNPPCVNPNHLWLGTHKDNMHDRDKKGRGANNFGVGENHIGRIFTDKEELKIYKEYVPRRITAVFLAKKYGASENTIRRIIGKKEIESNQINE